MYVFLVAAGNLVIVNIIVDVAIIFFIYFVTKLLTHSILLWGFDGFFFWQELVVTLSTILI